MEAFRVEVAQFKNNTSRRLEVILNENQIKKRHMYMN